MSTKSDSLREFFSQELSKITNGNFARIIVFTHRQADADALCAASGLIDLVTQFFPTVKIESMIVVPQGASSLGQTVCNQLGIKFVSEVESPTLQDCKIIVVVDTGDPHLLEPFSEQVMKSKARKILIDHHSSSQPEEGWSAFDRFFVNRNSTSTCEILVQGFPEESFSRETAQKLLTGLMFDSQHLGIATASTLEAALILVRAGAEIDLAKKALRNKPNRSELLARIKSAQRLQYEEVGKFLILRTEVSSFQASVARMLLDVGADVGIAYGESNQEARVSARSTQAFFKETGIDLAEQMKKIADGLGLVGGGHPTAASLSGKGVPLELAKKVAESLTLVLPHS